MTLIFICEFSEWADQKKNDDERKEKNAFN